MLQIICGAPVTVNSFRAVDKREYLVIIRDNIC